MSTDKTSKDDRHQILQLTIDLDVLDKYYHEGVAGRKPLQIVKSEAVPDALDLKKFGEPVRVIPRADAEGKGLAYLEIKKLEIDGTRAQVDFAYPVEGVQGTAKFQKGDAGWRVESRELHER